MNRDTLIKEWIDAATTVTMYNMADGPQSHLEQLGRSKARQKLARLSELLHEAGISREELDPNGELKI